MARPLYWRRADFARDGAWLGKISDSFISATRGNAFAAIFCATWMMTVAMTNTQPSHIHRLRPTLSGGAHRPMAQLNPTPSAIGSTMIRPRMSAARRG